MVHGADSHDGRVGFWMDLVEGQTLEQRVRDGRLSAGETIYVGQELCRALAAVHQANLLHRDIKAQNVMRAADGGRIILMDFGAGEFRDAASDRATARYAALSGAGAADRRRCDSGERHLFAWRPSLLPRQRSLSRRGQVVFGHGPGACATPATAPS